MLFSVAAVTISTDEHATHTNAASLGSPTLDMKREALEQMISLCPEGQSLYVMIPQPELLAGGVRETAEDHPVVG
jgi:hypothetical protein